MGFYDKKRVLVTGGTGLIGRPLVEGLLEKGANVRIASLDPASRAHQDVEFHQVDLTERQNCRDVCKGMNYVFNLVGVKSTPKMSLEKPASYLVPTLLFNTNMMEAAREEGVENYMFTSTIGVYAPAPVFYEDDVWKTFPSEKDRFPGWAKRIGELQAEAYRIQYGWEGISIVRPANVYGPHDNFCSENSMVVPSLIKRAVDGENPMVVWGDGSAVRDFIHARDVADGMMRVMESGYTEPVNIGSGNGYSISALVDAILPNLKKRPQVEWDTTKPTGDKMRVMDNSRMRSLGWEPRISLEEGVREVMGWYSRNRGDAGKRYDVFDEDGEDG